MSFSSICMAVEPRTLLRAPDGDARAGLSASRMPADVVPVVSRRSALDAAQLMTCRQPVQNWLSRPASTEIFAVRGRLMFASPGR